MTINIVYYYSLVCTRMSKNDGPFIYRPKRIRGTVPDEPEGLRVENNGFEPLTPCLQSRCSSQLS